MSNITQIKRLKQSIWVDHLERLYLESHFESDLRHGVSGMTSNPTILCRGIEGGYYDNQIRHLVEQGKDSLDIYEELIRQDASVAASLLHFVYASTDKLDGYVSIEVDPAFANRVESSVYQGAYLYNMIDCPNVMIKVPGTDAGIESLKQLIFDGIPVNVTLLFSVDQYEKVAWAYIEALEDRIADGKPVDIASVASFFISRIDVAVDNALRNRGDIDYEEISKKLWCQVSRASAKLAYEKWYEIFHSPRFIALRHEGAKPQRLLWASTSNKYGHDDPLRYVKTLIAANTVNTLPPQTLKHTIECKTPIPLTDTLDRYPSFSAQECFDELKKLRIDLRELTDALLARGIQLFMESFDDLMFCIYNRIREERGVHASRDSQS